MEIGATAVAGFVAEKVAGELLQNLLQISVTFLFCRESAENLKDTVHALVPVIEKIRGSGVDVPEPRRSHIDHISRCLQEGLEITRKILESPWYSFFWAFQLARKMDKLEKEISKFTGVIIQAHILAEMSHMRSEGAASFHRLEGSNHRIERSLLKINVGSGSGMAGSLTDIQYEEEAWGSASRREEEIVAEGYPAEEAWATGGHGREWEKGDDGYDANEAWSIRGRSRKRVRDAEEVGSSSGCSRKRVRDAEEVGSSSGCSRKRVKDAEECSSAEEDITEIGISGLKCGLKKDSSV